MKAQEVGKAVVGLIHRRDNLSDARVNPTFVIELKACTKSHKGRNQAPQNLARIDQLLPSNLSKHIIILKCPALSNRQHPSFLSRSRTIVGWSFDIQGIQARGRSGRGRNMYMYISIYT